MSHRPRSAAIAAVALLAMAAPAAAQPRITVRRGEEAVKARQANQPRPRGQASAYRPIPLPEAAATSGLTMAESFDRFAAIEKRWLLESYKRSHAHDAALEPRVVRFLEQAARCYAGPSVQHYPSSLAKEGLELLAGGCKDPMVVWTALWLTHESGFRPANLDLMAQLLDEMSIVGAWEPARVSLFARWLGQELLDVGRQAEAARCFGIMGDQLVKAAANPQMDPMEQRYLFTKYATLSDGETLELAGSINDRIQRNKDIPEWFRLMFEGTYKTDLAWNARTASVAREVTREGWAGFAKHLTAARDALERAHALAPQHPDAATAMIRVTMGGHGAPGKPIRYWFDQAVKAEIDGFAPYHSYVHALRPRWGGSYEAMFDFGIECTSVTRPDAISPLYFIHVAHTICDDTHDFTRVWQSREITDASVRMLEAAIADPGLEMYADMYRTQLTSIAVHAGRWDVARRAMDGLRQPMPQEFAQEFRLTLREIMTEVYPRTEASTKEHVLAADALTAKGDFAGAYAALGKAKGVAPAESALGFGVLHLLERARVRHGMQGTDWVDLSPDPSADGAGWRMVYGKNWAPHPRGFEHVGEGLALLTHAAPVGERFEFEATILFTPQPSDWTDAGARPGRGAPKPFKMYEIRHGAAGLAFSYGRGTGAWLSALLDPASGKATVGVLNQADVAADVSIKPDEPTTIRATRFDDLLIVQVNGWTTYRGPCPRPDGWVPGDSIGLLITGTSARPSVGFRDVRIRRLDDLPADMRRADVPNR